MPKLLANGFSVGYDGGAAALAANDAGVYWNVGFGLETCSRSQFDATTEGIQGACLGEFDASSPRAVGQPFVPPCVQEGFSGLDSVASLGATIYTIDYYGTFPGCGSSNPGEIVACTIGGTCRALAGINYGSASSVLAVDAVNVYWTDANAAGYPTVMRIPHH